ncbi:MAG TPA: adenylate/guanylate cyclase domain-containing protein [Actinomycetota bacterium]
MRTCSRCGRENADDAQFCNACGSPLANGTRAREERKVVTVLFADLVGFTGRSERLDPEDVRATLTPYFARLREELERRGGTVEKFIGDAVMAVFGAPTAHEDDPERAVRAALAIREAVAEMNEQDPDLDLHVRIGITTGEALVSLEADPLQGEGIAAGDVVNTAARLQSAAPVDGIVVGDATHRATERAFDYRSLDPVDAKGKAEPVHAWEVIEARSRFGVDVTRRVDTPLVGRERELALLRDALDRVRLQDEPQLVTLVGEPGIGKSRLVHELYAYVESFSDLITWRQGRCLPYGEGISYWALGEIVKAEAGILETDPDTAASEKLERTVEALVPGNERSWVARNLRPLIGVVTGQVAAAEASEDAPAAWRRFLEGMAERRPTVLIFEDLHWADEGLLDFLDVTIDWMRDVPLLVLCTARPELLSRRPGWGGGKLNAATISLSPLSDPETARLLAGLFDRAVLPADLQATLLNRAGGNPLYAEEFARMTTGRSADELASLELPDSVQGIISARLDGLEPGDKTLLQDAAVVGKAFWPGAVTAIGGTAVTEDRLLPLERGRFVRRSRRSSVGAEAEYTFLHALVRDVAYGQIPRAERAEKHRAAATWIASLSGDRLEDRAELLAHHHVAALELARAAGLDTAPFEGPARLALRAAGDRAMALGALPTAERAYAAAVELWPDDDPDRPDLLLRYGRALWAWRDAGEDVLEEARDAFLAKGDPGSAAEAELMVSDLIWRRGHGAEAEARIEGAIRLTEGLPPSAELAVVKAHIARFFMVAGRSYDAIRVGSEALAIAAELGRDDITTFALNSVGAARVNTGDLAGFAEIEESIRVAEEASLPWHVLRNNVNLGVNLFYVGDVRRALEVHQENLELAHRFGLQGPIIWNTAEVAFDLFLVGRWDESLALVDAELARMEAGAPHYLEVQHRQTRARIRAGRGDPEGALSDIERGVAVGRSARDPQALFPNLAERGRILLAVGRVDDAVASIEEILRSTDPESAMDRSWWIVAAAIVFTEVGRGDEILAFGGEELPSKWIHAARAWAAGDLAGAAGVFADIGSAPDEAYARLKLAEVLLQEGRRSEAEPELGRALELFRGMGATGLIRDAERLLAPPA